jgi:hypothetical protein
MRIICVYTDHGSFLVRSGWGRVFEAMGHEFYFWRPDTKPAFDIFQEINPDLFIGTTNSLDSATYKCIKNRPDMKVIMQASLWGSLTEEIPEDYPIRKAGLMEKRMVSDLWKEVQKPNFVFSNLHYFYQEDFLSGWKETGVPYHGIMNAADTFLYLNGTRREELVCDLGYVGGYSDYKSKNLNRYILPLCHPSAGLKVKIFGKQVWPIAQHLSTIEDEEMKDLFVSAAICPNLSKPHCAEFGFDVPERLFQIGAAGGFCISDHVEGLRDIFGMDQIPMFKNPTDYIDAVHHYLENPELRQIMANKAQKAVLDNHTYFHRVGALFLALGDNAEAERCFKLYAKLIFGKED